MPEKNVKVALVQHPPVFDKAEIIYGKLDLDLIRQGNLLLDTDGHHSRHDVFELRVNDKLNKNVIFASDE